MNRRNNEAQAHIALLSRFTDTNVYGTSPFKYEKLATKYQWIYGYFLQRTELTFSQVASSRYFLQCCYHDRKQPTLCYWSPYSCKVANVEFIICRVNARNISHCDHLFWVFLFVLYTGETDVWEHLLFARRSNLWLVQLAGFNFTQIPSKYFLVKKSWDLGSAGLILNP